MRDNEVVARDVGEATWAFCFITSAGVRIAHDVVSAIAEDKEWTADCNA